MDPGSEARNPISLRRVLPEAELVGADDVPVAHCTCDSRRVQPGGLFVALVGRRHDGHDFVAEAIGRGARAIVVQRPLAGLDVPVCRVSDSREAYGRICQALAGDPGRRLKVAGVTGTNGKTTTCFLLAGILEAAGHEVAINGTLGCFDGQIWAETSLTTPPADALAAWLARAVHNGCTHAVLEVSSHALDQARVAGIPLAAACVTNVRRDHLDYHATFEDYRVAKSRLLGYLAPGGFAVFNADDATSFACLSAAGVPALTVGIRSAAEVSATVLERFRSEQTFLLTAGSESIAVRTRMIGTHHIYNCLAAAAMGLAYGIDMTTVARGLESVQRVPGRLERIECGQPFGVFVDYAHTADALTGALRTLRGVTAGRLICVFGAGGDRDRQKRPAMGRAVEEHADVAVITTDNPRRERPEAIEAEILGGFRNPAAARRVPDRVEAIHWALAHALPDDCVLIAGRGHERYQVIGDCRYELDDRQVARSWLYENQTTGIFPPG